MLFQIFAVFSVLGLCAAGVPVMYQDDSSVIVSEPMLESLPQEHRFVPVNYQYYEVVGNQEVDPEILPNDLIEIARTKLGIKKLEEIPSVSALGELLGTSSREETIEAIRQLTATDSGIDLIKAFIESSDYTDATAIEEPEPSEADTSGPLLPTSILSETAQKDLEIAQKVLTTPKPELGFFQRVSSYFKYFDLFPRNEAIPVSPVNKKLEQLDDVENFTDSDESEHSDVVSIQPLSVADIPPPSYAIPVRPGDVYPLPPIRPYRTFILNRSP